MVAPVWDVEKPDIANVMSTSVGLDTTRVTASGISTDVPKTSTLNGMATQVETLVKLVLFALVYKKILRCFITCCLYWQRAVLSVHRASRHPQQDVDPATSFPPLTLPPNKPRPVRCLHVKNIQLFSNNKEKNSFELTILLLSDLIFT